jgi:hypothetical protein
LAQIASGNPKQGRRNCESALSSAENLGDMSLPFRARNVAAAQVSIAGTAEETKFPVAVTGPKEIASRLEKTAGQSASHQLQPEGSRGVSRSTKARSLEC